MRRFLKHNATSEIPSSLLFVDTESSINKIGNGVTKLELRLWCAKYCRLENGVDRSITFNSGTTHFEFWRFVESLLQERKPLWIFAHNAAFDMRQLSLYRQFDEGRLIYSPAVEPGQETRKRSRSIIAVDGRPWFIKCQHKSLKTLWIVNTMNYYQMSLEQLGRSFGLQKLTVDFEKATDRELEAYCYRDVEIIYRAMVGLISKWQESGLGNWRSSAAGLSMQNFRHWHVAREHKVEDSKEKWPIVCDSESEHIPLEREAYLGGRIEAFYLGARKQRVYHVDVKSMYPSVMREGFYPVERIGFKESPEVCDIAAILPARGCVARILVNSNSLCYPLRFRGRQIQANGKFWSVLCGSELIRCIENGHAEKIDSCVIYRTAPIFRQWVEYWFNRRLEADHKGDYADSHLCKLVLNSLHGKFAQRGVAWQDSTIAAPIARNGECMRWGTFHYYDALSKASKTCRVFAGCVQEPTDGKNPEHCFPAISAFICADARERLNHLISVCPKKSVLYCAVDSLIVTEAGFYALCQSGEVAKDELGKLTLKGEHSEFEIISQGCYRLDGELTATGNFGRSRLNPTGQLVADLWNTGTPFQSGTDPTVTITESMIAPIESHPKGKLGSDGWITPLCFDPPKEYWQLSPSEAIKWQEQQDYESV